MLRENIYNSENMDMNSEKQLKCMEYHQNKYRSRQINGELTLGINEKRPLQKPSIRSASAYDERQNINLGNQSMTINIDKLNEQIQELVLVREMNNKELIRLETELQNEKNRADKAMNERNTLIEALDDLTVRANQVEQTCLKLTKENEELEFKNKQLEQKHDSFKAYADKITGLNCIIDQIKEQLHDKDLAYRDLSLKLENSLQEKSSLKKKIKNLESEQSRIREEFIQKSEATKEKYDRRISELEESVKILTKCIDKYEAQSNQYHEAKEQLKLAQYQLSKVTRERDSLKAAFTKDSTDYQRDTLNQKKFESVYNKCRQTLEQNKDLELCNLVKNDFSPIKNYDNDNISREQRQLYHEFKDEISDKDVLENDEGFINDKNKFIFKIENEDDNTKIQRIIKREQEKNAKLLEELKHYF